MGRRRLEAAWRGSARLVVLALGVAAPAVAFTTLGERSADARLDRMAEGRPGDPLPPGWSVRTVSGFTAPKSELVRTPADTPFDEAIRFQSDGQAAFFWLELEEARQAGSGRLTWRWRVDTPVPGADLGTPATDDAPARFFVAFGQGGLFSTPRMIFYSWGGRDEIGAQWAHEGSDKVRVMVLRNDRSPTRTWLEETRDLDADHRAVFGSSPSDPVTAVGFMVDTDATGARASSVLGPILWVKGGSAEPETRPPSNGGPGGQQGNH